MTGEYTAIPTAIPWTITPTERIAGFAPAIRGPPSPPVMGALPAKGSANQRRSMRASRVTESGVAEGNW